MITWEFFAGVAAGVATTMTIAGGIWSAHRALLSRQQRLRIYWSRSVLIPTLLYLDFTVTIRDSEGIETARLIRDFALITNNTTVSISAQDLLRYPYIPSSSPGTLFKIYQVPTPNSGSFTTYRTDEGVILHDLIIPRASGVMFEVFHDGSFLPTIDLQLRALRDPQYIEVLTEKSGRYRGFMMTTLLAMSIITAAPLFFGGLWIFNQYDALLNYPDLQWLTMLLLMSVTPIGVIAFDAKYHVTDKLERWFARRMGRPSIFDVYTERVRQNRLFYDDARWVADEVGFFNGTHMPGR